jgi:hypothetical protein
MPPKWVLVSVATWLVVGLALLILVTAMLS